MANEAILKYYMEDPLDMIVANGTGIEKGATMRLTSSGTAIQASSSGVPPAGIAAREKVASDGRTRLACYQRGVFQMTLATNSTCEVGNLMVFSGTNTIAKAGDYGTTGSQIQEATISGLIIGRALGDGVSGGYVDVLINL